MPTPTYILDCPGCGGQLTPHAGHPQSTPWICNECARGWWVAELTREARIHYRPSHHDWGYDRAAAEALHAARLAEVEAAQARATSLLPEHLALLDARTLTGFLAHFGPRLDPALVAEVEAALKARGD